MCPHLLPLAVLIAFESTAAFAGGRGLSGGSVPVHGYVKRDGTYVAPHHRTAPDKDFSNNWSTEGNVNPYTGEDGKLTQPPLRGTGISPLPGPLRTPPSSESVTPGLAPAALRTDDFSLAPQQTQTSVTPSIPAVNNSHPLAPTKALRSPASMGAMSYQDAQKVRDVERANFWQARGHLFNPAYMSAYSMDQKVKDIERAAYWKQRDYAFNPEYMSAYSMDQKVKDIERSRYWKSKGHQFNPEYLSAYSMDQKVRDIERAKYWKDRDLSFDPNYMSAYSMDHEAERLLRRTK